MAKYFKSVTDRLPPDFYDRFIRPRIFKTDPPNPAPPHDYKKIRIPETKSEKESPIIQVARARSSSCGKRTAASVSMGLILVCCLIAFKMFVVPLNNLNQRFADVVGSKMTTFLQLKNLDDFDQNAAAIAELKERDLRKEKRGKAAVVFKESGKESSSYWCSNGSINGGVNKFGSNEEMDLLPYLTQLHELNESFQTSTEQKHTVEDLNLRVAEAVQSCTEARGKIMLRETQLRAFDSSVSAQRTDRLSAKMSSGSDIDGIGTGLICEGYAGRTRHVLDTECPGVDGERNMDLNKSDNLAGQTLLVKAVTNFQETEQQILTRCGEGSEKACDNPELTLIWSEHLLASEVAGSWAADTAPSVYGDDDDGKAHRGRCVHDSKTQGVAESQNSTLALKTHSDVKRQALSNMIGMMAPVPNVKKQFGKTLMKNFGEMNSEIPVSNDSETWHRDEL